MPKLSDLVQRRSFGFSGDEGALFDEMDYQNRLASLANPRTITNASLGQAPQNYIQRTGGQRIDLGPSMQEGSYGGAQGYRDPQGNITTYTPSGEPVTMSGREIANIKAQAQAEREFRNLQNQAMIKQMQEKAGALNPTEQLARDKFEWEKGQGSNSALKSTEDEKKSAGYVVRMETALKQMEDVASKNPNQATPNPFIQMLGGVSETAKNYAQPVARQRIESAQEDALDAALTLATGAAYTKEQLKGLRSSYFPMAGDAPETIADKRARFADVIKTARLRAGRMEPGANQVIAGSSQTGAVQPANQDAEAIAWANANPNDPRAARILSLHGG